MKRFILTGAPGSGKTAIIRQLELDGFSVVEEAATDIIAAEQARGVAEPWKSASFIDKIAEFQRDRLLAVYDQPVGIQFHDRSVFCTAALAAYLGYDLSPALAAELDRIKREDVFAKQVFFVRNLGFITNTEARRITFEETLRFETIHEQAYRDHGFELVDIPAGTINDRAAQIKLLANELTPAT